MSRYQAFRYPLLSSSFDAEWEPYETITYIVIFAWTKPWTKKRICCAMTDFTSRLLLNANREIDIPSNCNEDQNPSFCGPRCHTSILPFRLKLEMGISDI